MGGVARAQCGTGPVPHTKGRLIERTHALNATLRVAIRDVPREPSPAGRSARTTTVPWGGRWLRVVLAARYDSDWWRGSQGVCLPFSLVRSHFTIMSEADISSPRRRRWFRFTLRTLLLVTFLVALAASYMGHHVARARLERRVAAEVWDAGGRAVYSHQIQQENPLGLRSEAVSVGPPGPWPIRRLFGDDIFDAVHYVVFSNNPSVNEKGLTRLHELTELRHLELHGERFTDAGIDDLLKIRHLQRLHLRDTSITPAGLGRLSQLPALQELGIIGSSVTDAYAEQLTSFPHLETVYFIQTRITDEGLSSLAAMTGLRRLGIVQALGGGVSDTGIAALASLRDLEELSLAGTPVTDESLRMIGELRNLRMLYFGLSDVTDGGMMHLEGLHALETLILSGTEVGDEGIAVVAGMPRLRELYLGGTLITDRGLDHLEGLADLEYLNICGTDVTDAGLVKLRGLKSLTSLHVTLGEGMTAEGVDALKVHLPGCTVECFEGHPLRGMRPVGER